MCRKCTDNKKRCYIPCITELYTYTSWYNTHKIFVHFEHLRQLEDTQRYQHRIGAKKLGPLTHYHRISAHGIATPPSPLLPFPFFLSFLPSLLTLTFVRTHTHTKFLHHYSSIPFHVLFLICSQSTESAGMEYSDLGVGGSRSQQP